MYYNYLLVLTSLGPAFDSSVARTMGSIFTLRFLVLCFIKNRGLITGTVLGAKNVAVKCCCGY